MGGTRPLTPAEFDEAINSFGGRYAGRDRLMLAFGVATGYRIAEILSLQQRQLWRDGRIPDWVKVRRGYMKGQRASRRMPLTRNLHPPIIEWMDQLEAMGLRGERWPVFVSRVTDGRGNPKAISYRRALQIIQECFEECFMDGSLATHSMRKTFAKRFMDAGGDLKRLKDILCHADLRVTEHYVDFDIEESYDLVRQINGGSQ